MLAVCTVLRYFDWLRESLLLPLLWSRRTLTFLVSMLRMLLGEFERVVNPWSFGVIEPPIPATPVQIEPR